MDFYSKMVKGKNLKVDGLVKNFDSKLVCMNYEIGLMNNIEDDPHFKQDMATFIKEFPYIEP